MGFYGNITNTSRTQFQFDRVYINRREMDQAASEDGIYAGRYVLVNYEEEGATDYYLHAYKIASESGFLFGSSYNGEELTRFLYVDSPEDARDKNVVFNGQVIVIPPDHLHNLVDLNATEWEYWRVNGYAEVERPVEGDSENEPETEIIKYATFAQFQDPYALNYNVDVSFYGTSRGYDSTVWQKVYQNGEDKYVMVAELNTVVPTFDIEADAPKMVPLTPHFDASSTNVYYKLHWSPPWGFRVKAASPELKGPILNDNGTDSSSGLTYMTSNSEEYPSDETTTWYKTVYNGVDAATDYVFTLNEQKNQGKWIPKDENLREDKLIDNIYQKEVVIETPAAIYYNKAGFDPETISYSYFETEIENQQEYDNGTYYKKVDGKYVLADDLEFDEENGPFYKKIEDHILLQPTGRSGHVYNKHDGSITDSVQEDMQELSIMLPAIGDTISAVWDLMYGGETVNHGLKRNLDVSWERARAGMDRHGLRLVTDFDAGGQYYYQVKNIDTVAGAINSIHDLMGMIITADTRAHLDDNIDALDENRIYYDESNHTFNRKRKMYDYTEILESAYAYDKVYWYDATDVTNLGHPMSAETWLPGTYYITEDEGSTFTLDNSEEFDIHQDYYLRRLVSGSGYRLVDRSKLDIFDGTEYAYQDFTGTDANSYQYNDITDTINSNNYVANRYYTESIGRYKLDDSEVYDNHKHYYQLVVTVDSETNEEIINYVDKSNDVNINNYQSNLYYINIVPGIYIIDASPTYDQYKHYYQQTTLIDPLKLDYVRDNKYYEDKRNGYYRWDEIVTVPYNRLSDSYEKNKFYYYDENTGNYVLSTDETPKTGRNYLILKSENLKTLESLVNQGEAYGLYLPGKYLYKEFYDPITEVVITDRNSINENTPFNYKLATASNLTDALKKNISGAFYLLQTDSNQTAIGDVIYTRVIDYEEVDLIVNGENNYVPRTYYTQSVDENNNIIYVRCDDPEYDPSKEPYYIQNESYIRVKSEYYQVNGNTAYTLFPFTRNTYFKKVKNNYEVLTQLSNAIDLTSNKAPIYVLRRERNTSGTFALNIPLDWTNISVSAMVLQDQFYEPGIYHYLSQSSNGDQYGDYILDTYPTKTHGENYYKIESIGQPVDFSDKIFFEAYKYYTVNSAGEYTLITDGSHIPEGDIYTYDDALYVINDETGIYPYGALWNFDTKYVPSTLTLAKRTEYYGLEPFADFARNINTMHGMLLKTKAMLDYENKDTRDIRTVQGALNTLADKIAQFSTWTSGEILIVDNYGRLHSADKIKTKWTQIDVDPQIKEPNIKVTHLWTAIPDTTNTTNLKENNSASLVNIYPLVDEAGHVGGKHTETYLLPEAYGIITGDSGSVAAGGTHATMKFEGTDEWIQTEATTESDVKKVKFTHEFNRGTDTTETINLSTNNAATFDDVKTLRDATGHEVATHTTTIQFPHGYGTVIGDSGSVAAGGTYATVKFEGTDNWIQTEAVTEDNIKKIKFTHEYTAGTNTTATVNLSTNNSATFEDILPTVDSKGHVTAQKTTTITFPHGYGVVQGDSGTDLAAGGSYATIMFNGADDWTATEVATVNDLRTVKITHTGPVSNNATAVGPTSAQTPAFGGTVNIPAFAIDAKGHVATTGTQTITVPSLSLVSGDNTSITANLANVITGLTYAADTNSSTFTKTESAVKDLLLTGYTASTIAQADLTAIGSSDSIGIAFNKIQNAVNNINNVIEAMDLAEITAGTGEVISAVSQTNGQISVSKKSLEATDIPDIQANEFEYTPTGKTDAETFSLQTIIDRLVALEDAQ